ncbi:MAG: DNA cytosine methyltransferase, partial [Bacteroidota bacterium]
MKKTGNVLGLFSGAGGLDVGFHGCGFNIKACIDIDADSCRSLELNKGKYIDSQTIIYNEDITTIDFEQLKSEVGEIDFIIGGPPCQSFSAAGRRAGGVTGVNDTRGSLFYYYCQALKAFRPKGFLFENVRGILQANKLKDWEIIKSSFSELGYNLNYRILDAAAYGVAQHRERVILVGSLDQSFLFPRPTHGPDSKSKRPYTKSIDVLEELNDPHEKVAPYGGKYGHLIADVPPGMNYSFYTERMGHKEPKFAWRSKFSGFLYKLDPDKPSKTIVAYQGKYDGPFHWEKDRKLNVDELKRIQSFPDDYQLFGSVNSQIRQIGNSVAPLFAKELAKAVHDQFYTKKYGIELIDNDVKLSFDKRKGKKARVTRAKRKASSDVATDQLSMFDQPASLVNQDEIRFDLNADWKVKAKLNNGFWKVKVDNKTKDKKSKKINVVLDFHDAVNNKFNKISLDQRYNSIWDIKYGWEAIHQLVDRSSSYESLLPLYGHFTEPYPKFRIRIKHDKNEPSKLTDLLNKISDYSFLGKLHKLDVLNEYSDFEQPIELVKMLRTISFDIRVHETNRSIPEGLFKFCYPFTLPEKHMSFVS